MKNKFALIAFCMALTPFLSPAQPDTINWEQIHLTGIQFKEGMIPPPVPKVIWPWYVGGGLAAGAGVYLLTREKEEEPLPLLFARSDQFDVPCDGSATVNIIANDTGEDITVIDISPPQPPGATVTLGMGGDVTISNPGPIVSFFTYTIRDRFGQTSSAEVVIFPVDTQAPTITCPANTSVPFGSPIDPAVTGTPTASDNCTPVPQIGINFSDQTTGTGCSQIITRTWTATDLAGNTTSCQQIITVEDVDPPGIICPADIVLECGSPTDPSVTGFPTATDNCTPPGNIEFQFTDSGGGTGCEQTILRTWIAIDGAGNVSLPCIQAITLVDTEPPLMICPPPVIVTCDQILDLGITGFPEVFDACSGPAVTVLFEDNLSEFNDCAGIITRTWLAMDICFNPTVCTQVIFVPEGGIAGQDDAPSLLLQPIFESRLHNDLQSRMAGMWKELPGPALPEHPRLSPLESPMILLDLPAGISAGIPLGGRWQLLVQSMKARGQIAQNFQDAGSLPADERWQAHMPFRMTDNRIGLRFFGKRQGRSTPFAGIAGQWQRISFQDGTATDGSQAFRIQAFDKEEFWTGFLEAGWRIKAGENTWFDWQLEYQHMPWDRQGGSRAALVPGVWLRCGLR